MVVKPKNIDEYLAALSDLVVFSVLFPTGFAAPKVGLPFWIGSVILLVSAIVGLNAQVVVDAKLIVDSYLGRGFFSFQEAGLL
jgi:hypothetical protein